MSSERRVGCARCLWGGGSAHELSARTRRVALLKGWSTPHEQGAPPARGRSPSVYGRGATCQLRPPTPDRRPRVKQAQVRLRLLSPGAGEPPKPAKHARRTTRVVIGVWRYKYLHRLEAALFRRAAVVRRVSYNLQRKSGGHVSSERSPSTCGRGATCQLQPATPNRRPHVKRAQAGLRSLSLGRTLSIRAFCARAPAALVVGGRFLIKGAAPARGRSPSVHGRGATCQLQPSTPDRRPRVKQAQARMRLLGLGSRRSTQAR